MCGIFGMIGKSNVVPNALGGIEGLEYRGYDSAGIGYIEKNKVKVIKQVGEIKNLKTEVGRVNPVSFNCVAHTRWATHGKPNKTNAHPFVSTNKDFCLVHNGIIENYAELKKQLNCKFLSETDSEVILKLIEKYYCENMLETLVKVSKLLKGSYALAIISSKEPDKLFVSKMVSPCVVGISADGTKVCSDINGIGKVDYSYVLENNNFAVLTVDGIKIYNEKLEQVKLKKIKVEKSDINNKGKFDYFMQKEIYEIPNSVNNTVNLYQTFEQFEKVLPKTIVKKTKNIIIVGCGTAYHAGLMGRKIFEQNLNLNIKNELASEFIYSKFVPPKNTLMIFVSQSGETADTLKALKIAKQYGLKTIAITNVKNSSISFIADYCFYTLAGAEVAVASTKAYVSQLSMFYLLASYFKEVIKDKIGLLESTANNLKNISKQINLTKFNILANNVANDIYLSQSLYMIGRNFDYVTALESSLKLKEISYIHSEAYASGELKHGTISLIDNNTFVFAFLTEKDLLEKSLSNVNEVISRGGKVILLTQYNLKSDNVYKLIKLNNIDEFYMPIVVIVIMQLIAFHVSVLKKLNPDKPRSLAKSVTVE